MKKVTYILFLAVLLVSCASKNTIKMTIASETRPCSAGVMMMDCMLVKEDNTKDWSFFYNHIDGFNYEKGYEYVLEVKKEELENVPADVSSLKYILVKQISKIEKASENLPPLPDK